MFSFKRVNGVGSPKMKIMNKLFLVILALFLFGCNESRKQSHIDDELLEYNKACIEEIISDLEIRRVISPKRYEKVYNEVKMLHADFELARRRNHVDSLFYRISKLEDEHRNFPGIDKIKRLKEIITSNIKSDSKAEISLLLFMLESSTYELMIKEVEISCCYTNRLNAYLFKGKDSSYVVFSAIDTLCKPWVIDSLVFEKMDRERRNPTLNRDGKIYKEYEFDGISRISNKKLRNDSLEVFLTLPDGSSWNMKAKKISLK